MPFIPSGPRPLLEGSREVDPKEKPDFLTETIPAALRTENIIGSALSHPSLSVTEDEIDFDPFADIEGYEEHARSFINAGSAGEVEAVKASIDRERRDREILASSGAGGFVAALASSLIDPTVFIPVGGTLKKGESILRVTARTMAAGGFATAAQEAGLQSTQNLRTAEESAINIAGASLLSGVLGAGFGALSKVDRTKLASAVEKDLTHPGAEFDPADPFQSVPVGKSALDGSASSGSLSAASRNVADDLVDDLNSNTVFLSDLASKAAKRTGSDAAAKAADVFEHAATKGIGLADPTYRLITSPLNVVRNIVQDLADIPLILNKNRASVEKIRLADGSVEERVIFGRPTTQSVESAITRKTEKFTGIANRAVDDIYLRYLNGRQRRLGDRFGAGVLAVTKRLPKDKLPPREFEREVWRALSRSDQHPIAEVAEAAKFLRDNFFKPIEDEAVELGMFGLERQASPFAGEPDILVPRRPDVAGTAESYRPRIYNVRKIRQRRDEFINRIYRHFQRERDIAAARAEQLETRIEDLQTNEIDVLRKLARDTLKRGSKALRDAREKLQAARETARKTEGRKKEANTQFNEAQRRSDLINQVRELSDEQLVYYSGLARDVTRGHGKERPERVIQWVRAQGGFNKAVRGFDNPDIFGGASSRHESVLDYLGTDEVTSLGRRRLLNDKGKSPDYMREAAVEARWLPEDATVDDLMDLIRRDLNGERVIHEDDLALADHEDLLAQIREEAERADVDYTDPINLASWMEGEEFTKLTAFQRGKLNEALRREKYALERFRGAESRAATVDDALHEAEVYARTMREIAPDFAEQAELYRKAVRKKIAEKKVTEREFGTALRRGEVGDKDLLANARRAVQRIESTPVGALSYDFAEATSGLSKKGKARTAGLSGRFKSRRLTIPDEEIEEFLEDDLEGVLRATARSMIPDIELTKRFGSVDLEPQMKAISDGFEDLISNIDPAGKAPNLKQGAGEAAEDFAKRNKSAVEAAATKAGKEKEALIRLRDRAMADVAGIRDRLRGVYGLPEDPASIGFRAINTLKSLNHLRLMGGVTMAALPDIARVAFSNGAGNFTGVALDFFTNGLKKIRLAGVELEEAGTAFEIVNDTRTMAFSDLIDDYGRYTKMERVIGAAKANFGQLSLMAPWNHVMKSIAGLTTQNRILKASSDLLDGKIAVGDAEFLAKLGIGEDDARSIGRLWREFGTDGRVRSANTQAWNDRRLADVFHDAMRKETDRIIVTPGQEKPLIASTPIGSFLLQFQAYNFAATQRVSLAYAQGLIGARDAHAAMAITTQIALGMAVAALKMQQAGRFEEVQDWEARRWIAEGLDRSGVLGVLTYYNLLSERATAGKIGLSALAGDGVLSRYHTRNAAGAFLGPSFGAAQDIFTVSSSLARGEGLTEGDAAALRRLLPYQNLFYVKWLFDQVERAAQDFTN